MSSELNITIGFSTQNDICSRVIRWCTRSPCSHSFIAFDDTVLRMRLVMQAKAWGFELRPQRRWLLSNVVVAEFKPIGNSLDEALISIAQSLGLKFDYMSGTLLLLRSLLGRWSQSGFSLRVKNSPGKLICSEAVIRFLKIADYRTVRDLDPELTGPGDLLREVMRNPHEFRLKDGNRVYLSYDRELGAVLDAVAEKRAIL